MRFRSYKTEKNHIEARVNEQSFDEVRKFLIAAVAKHNRSSEEKISYDISSVPLESTERNRKKTVELTNTQILIKNIQETIERRGLAYLEVAERAGISQYELEKLLTGRKVITAEYIPRIASALEVSIDALYGISATSVVIEGRKYSEIAVIDCDNCLVASIAADNIIEYNGYKVVCTR